MIWSIIKFVLLYVVRLGIECSKNFFKGRRAEYEKNIPAS